MFSITNENFIPFKNIPNNNNPLQTPDIVTYPNLFGGEIDQIMLNKLSYLEYSYIISHSVRSSLEEGFIYENSKILWFADNPESMYVYSENILHEISVNNFQNFIRCIQFGVERITGKKINSFLLNSEFNIENNFWYDESWSKEQFIVSFGDRQQSLQFVSKNNSNSEFNINIGNGTMVVLRENVQKYWECIFNKNNNKSPFFHLVFRFIDSDLKNTIPYYPRELRSKKTPTIKISVANDSLTSIYLTNKQRVDLIKQIKNAMSGVVGINGEQCVNGKNPELLNKLELTKFLGRGTYGNVFAGCAPKPCGPNSYEFAVKLARVTKKSDISTPYVTNVQFWHEVYIHQNILNPLIINRISPNLPLLAESYTCSDCEFEFYDFKSKGLKRQNSACLIMLIELATGGDMSNWFNNDNPNNEEIYSALFQLMAGLHALQAHAQLVNTDIKAANVLVHNVNPGGYWKYVIHGQEFFVPNYGKLFIVNDFGVANLYSPNHKLVNSKSKKWSNLGDRYGMIINDVFTPLESNRSFSAGGRIDSPRILIWGDQNTNIQQQSHGGDSFISYNSDTILDTEIKFTPIQIQELNRLGIPADSKQKAFYEHPEIIPPFQFVGDTQDMIKSFIGGRRSFQQLLGLHPSYVTGEVKDKLERYNIKNYNYTSNIINLNPEKALAGYFIVKFFTQEKNYTRLPLNEIVIETYNIS